jgi:hypothetical protein
MHYGIRMTEVNEWIGLIDRMGGGRRGAELKGRKHALKTQ